MAHGPFRRAVRPGPGGLTVRVLLLHQHFVLGGEAGGTRHVELARHLVHRGHRVTVVASPLSYLTGEAHDSSGDGARDPAAGEEGIELLRTWTFRPRTEGFVGRVLSFLSFSASSVWAALFRVPDADVVWGTSPPIFQALGALLVARLRGLPFVLEIRDLWPDFAVELGVLRNPVLIALARQAERLLYHQADALVVNSPGFVDHLASHGIDREEVAVVPNGVEVEDFDPDTEGTAFRDELGVEPGVKLVTYTGAHGIPNDLDVFLDAARALVDRDDVRFVLVGGGRDKARLRERARAMELENLAFVDPRPKERMPEVLAASEVCVAILKPIPLFDTTYPNKVFDYMAAARPTVLAIDGVVRAVVEEAGGGTFVPPGDGEALARAVARYLDDPELARAHGRAARSWVARNFRREDHAEALREILVSVAPGR